MSRVGWPNRPPDSRRRRRYNGNLKTVAEEFTQSGAKLGSGPRLDDERRLHEEPL